MAQNGLLAQNQLLPPDGPQDQDESWDPRNCLSFLEAQQIHHDSQWYQTHFVTLLNLCLGFLCIAVFAAIHYATYAPNPQGNNTTAMPHP